MTRKADNRRYVTQRTLLIALMGSKCRYCSERRPWKLEFHHTKKSDECFQSTSRHRRIRLWARDWGLGKLVLACGKCNKRQGQPEREVGDEEEAIPF